LCLRNLHALRKEKLGVKIIEAPFEQTFGLVGPFLFGFEAIEDYDEALSVLQGGPHNAVAGFPAEAGLQAVRSDIHRQQGIAVGLPYLVECNLGLAVDSILIRIALDDMSGEERKLAHRHELPRMRQSV